MKKFDPSHVIVDRCAFVLKCADYSQKGVHRYNAANHADPAGSA